MVLQLYLYGFSMSYLGYSLLFTRLSHLADLKPPISTKTPQKLAEKKDCGVLQDLRSMPNINQSMSFFQARDRLDGSSKWHKSTCPSIEIHIVVRVNSSVKLPAVTTQIGCMKSADVILERTSFMGLVWPVTRRLGTRPKLFWEGWGHSGVHPPSWIDSMLPWSVPGSVRNEDHKSRFAIVKPVRPSKSYDNEVFWLKSVLYAIPNDHKICFQYSNDCFRCLCPSADTFLSWILAKSLLNKRMKNFPISMKKHPVRKPPNKTLCFVGESPELRSILVLLKL